MGRRLKSASHAFMYAKNHQISDCNAVINAAPAAANAMFVKGPAADIKNTSRLSSPCPWSLKGEITTAPGAANMKPNSSGRITASGRRL
jgi:hypothetical protein